jgi:hypothetical protein
MFAPLPGFDEAEDPILLIAVTYAHILEPQVKENGAKVNETLGMVHLVALTIPGKVPLQLAVNAEKVTPSLCRNSIK